MTFNEIYEKFKKLEEAVLVLSSSLVFVIISNIDRLDKHLVKTLLRVLDDTVPCIEDGRARTIKEDIERIRRSLN